MKSKLDKPRTTGQYIISGTDSFRLSCRKVLSNTHDTPYNNFGNNMQNIEKGIREIYIADVGYSLIQADQSGAEALIVAYLCRAAKYRSLFLNGVKPHVYMALKLFPHVWSKHLDEGKINQAINTEIPDLKKLSFWSQLEALIKSSDNWSSNERYYHLAKKTIHSSSYGMRGNTFRMAILQESGGTIVISLKDAESYLMQFHMEFPEIHEWHNQVFITARNKGRLINLFGFPFNITDFVNPNDFKDLIAWIPQSSVACITREAFCNLQDYIESNNKNWHLLGDCHDSYLCECPESEVNDCAKKMREFIEIEMKSPFDGTKFRMKSEVQSGKNWAPKKDKNPLGLEELK
jgi:DNA polymerase I-like protein with 3'-5' exonuclease and polymerase domains